MNIEELANEKANNSTQKNESDGNIDEPPFELPPPYSDHEPPPQYRVENPEVIVQNVAVQICQPSQGSANAEENQQQPLQCNPPVQQDGGNSTHIPTASESLEEYRARIDRLDRKTKSLLFNLHNQLVQFGVSLIGMSLLLLFVFCYVFVPRALKNNTLKSTTCHVTSSVRTREYTRCKYTCGKRSCYSSYPCVEIQVAYIKNNAHGEEFTAYLYKSVFRSDKENKCSTQPCESSIESNQENVDNFNNQYGQVGSQYTCYYNPKTPDEVFLDKGTIKSNHMIIFHSIFWLMLVIAISISLIGIGCCLKKRLLCFKKDSAFMIRYQDINNIELELRPR